MTSSAERLKAAGRTAELYALISKEWMETRRAQTGSDRAFLEDVETMIAAAQTDGPGDLVQEFRGLHICATLRARATAVRPQVVAALAWSGRVDRALGLAILAQNGASKGTSYVAIAEALLAQGRTAEAEALLWQAVEMAADLRSTADAAPLTARAAEMLVEMGASQQALALADARKSSTFIWIVLPRVVASLVRAGERHELITRIWAVVEVLDSDLAKVRVLARVAQVLVDNGEAEQAKSVVQRALTLAQAIEDQDARARARATVARTLVSVGEADRALEFAEAIEDPATRAQALAGVAKRLLAVGQARRALQVAEKIEPGDARAEVVAAATNALAGPGALDRASAVPVELAGLDNSPERLATQALALVQAGERERAAQRARRALTALEPQEDELVRAIALADSAQALARSGDQAGLALAAESAERELAETFERTRPHIRPLGAIAAALARVGDREQLAPVFTDMERQLYLDRTMVVLARALARIGEVDQAVALAEALTSRAARATALAAVASSLALTGDWARARAVAETIQPSTEDDYQARIVRLSALAAAQARAHERELLIGEASALLDVIKHDFDKVRALGRVAQVLLDAGEPRRGLEMARQALALAQRLDDHQARQPAMDTVLLVLADAGDREQALELARRRVAAAESAEDKLDRSALLSAAAAALSSAGLRQEAITALRSLLTIARSTPGGDFGEPLLDALAALVSMFSSSKQARELQELCTAIVSVETWW